MATTQFRMTLVQREVYSALLDHGMDPITLQELAAAARIHPGSVNQLMARCADQGLVRTWREIVLGSDKALRSQRLYALTVPGVQEMLRRLEMPRWPERA